MANILQLGPVTNISKYMNTVSVTLMFILCYRNESWFSALSLCKEQGGSLPQLDIREDIDYFLRHDLHSQELVYIFIGLTWVSIWSNNYFHVCVYGFSTFIFEKMKIFCILTTVSKQ